MCYERRAPDRCRRFLGFGSELSAEGPEGSNNKSMVQKIDPVGQVLWLIYKMSNYTSKGVIIY